MRKIKLFSLVICLASLLSCADLDLNPLSEGSSESWYSNDTEITMSLNKLYGASYWPVDQQQWTDDNLIRDEVTEIAANTINAQTGFVLSRWTNCYAAIAIANTIIDKLEQNKDKFPQETLDRYIAEARFHRAYQYGFLIARYGDVVYYTQPLELEEAFSLGRTSKNTILQAVYEDFDFAASKLPVSYGSSEIKRATKGAAYALKARIALYMSDWAVARDAAKNCMDLRVYELYPAFEDLFKSATKNTKEAVFAVPRSVALGSSVNQHTAKPRNVGGLAMITPSWDLFCSYLCSDGLPIDESPLFNPREPFKNRDPRLSKTIVEFGSPHLGFIYQPHPDSLTTLNLNTGKYQVNNDTRGTIQWASYNGLIWKKYIEDGYANSSFVGEPENIIIRFPEVLLMYAESKIELGEIDQSVLNAINMVRARAYETTYDQTDNYPEVTTTNKAELRRIVWTERRMEFAWEGIRYMDLIRWRLAEKVLTNPNYGMLDPAELREKIVNKGLWFFPQIPEIDEDGVPDFTSMYNNSLIKIVAIKKFDASRQYLWPIPAKEILINPNLEQNTGY